MKKKFSYGRQTIDLDDVRAVTNVLKSDWLTQGPAVKKFEIALSEKFRARHAIAVANGTAALHLTAMALKWQPNDIIITTPITFVASANCILYVGAQPDFVDIDSVTYTIDTHLLREKLEAYKKQQRRVRAVIAVDFAGHPSNWKKLRSLADEYNFQLVSDSCHALGARIDNDPGYAARYADAVIFSFHPVKHITTGEGGAILTNNDEMAERVQTLRNHGITKNSNRLSRHDGPWYYEMQHLGFNYRISDIQTALGYSQLKKLDDFIKRRRDIAEFYHSVFSKDNRLISPRELPGFYHSYHLYPLQIKFEKLKTSKINFFNILKGEGIFLQVHYIPVHLQPYYHLNFGFKKGDYPNAEQFYANEISIPMYPKLQKTDLNFITKKILQHLR